MATQPTLKEVQAELADLKAKLGMVDREAVITSRPVGATWGDPRTKAEMESVPDYYHHFRKVIDGVERVIHKRPRDPLTRPIIGKDSAGVEVVVGTEIVSPAKAETEKMIAEKLADGWERCDKKGKPLQKPGPKPKEDSKDA